MSPALLPSEWKSYPALSAVLKDHSKSIWDNTQKYTLLYVYFLKFKILNVIPSATRMYSDTDSAPTSLDDQKIERIGQNLPEDMTARYKILKNIDCP